MVSASTPSLKNHSLDSFGSVTKPKILFISDQMPLGGGSTSILNLCEGFRKDGSWSPHVSVFEPLHSIGSQIKARGIPVFGPCSGVIYEDRVAEMLEFCRRLQPQAIVAALGGSAFDFFRFLPTGCFRVAMIQSDDPNVYRQAVTYAHWFDVVAGVSQEICRKAKAALRSARTTVSYQPYGVPMPKVPAIPRRGEKLRVLYLGRLIEEQKRVNLMARIIEACLESQFPFHWTIAGDGDELPKLKERFADYPEYVCFLGEVPYNTVSNLFIENDVFFLCSDYEGLPLSLLEAMGSGLVPVVSNLRSGISEVVDHQNGIRVSIGNESGYLEALLKLVANRNLLDEMALKAISSVRSNFSIEAMTNRWLAMINASRRGTIDWKSHVPLTPPLQLKNKLFYHPLFKPLRRFYKRVSTRGAHSTKTMQA